MKIEKIIDDKTLTFVFDGCLDTESAPQLSSELDKIGTVEKLIFDFKKLEYISSSGLRQVITAYKKGVSQGYHFRIINVNNEVMAIFSVTKLADKLDITS